MLIAALQGWLDRGLAESSAARALAAELDGKSLCLVVLGTGLELELHARDGGVRAAAPPSGASDAVLRAAPLELLGLLGPDPLTRLKRSRAELTGEARVAEAFAELLRLAAPDLEDELAGWIGDVPAHELGSAVRAAAAQAHGVGRSLERSLGEYLTEEARMLPAPLEVRGFNAAVERLRDDVERLEQRVERLAAALDRGS